MIRVLIISSVLLITLAVPAFAETVVLTCTAPGSNAAPIYITIDTNANTVRDSDGTWPARITDKKVTWTSHNRTTGSNSTMYYDRDRAMLYGGYHCDGAQQKHF